MIALALAAMLMPVQPSTMPYAPTASTLRTDAIILMIGMNHCPGTVRNRTMSALLERLVERRLFATTTNAVEWLQEKADAEYLRYDRANRAGTLCFNVSRLEDEIYSRLPQ